MPTIVITEDWRAGDFKPSQSGVREFDISGTADFGEALVAMASTESVYEGAAYPIAAGEPIAIAKGGIGFRRNGRMIRATANYTPGPAATAIEGTALPTSKKWDCRLNFQFDGVQTVRDGVGTVITNSNRDSIGITFPSIDATIILQMARFETGSGLLAKALAYYRKWNSAPVTFPKLGTAAKGEALLAGIEVSENFTSASTYVKTLYTFHAKALITATNPTTFADEQIHGFRIHVPDVGTRAYGGSLGDALTIRFRNPNTEAAEIPPGPVPLNGRGAPLDSTGYCLRKLDVAAQAIVAVNAVNRDDAPTYYVTTAGVGTTLLYDASRGSADLNDLNIAANV